MRRCWASRWSLLLSLLSSIQTVGLFLDGFFLFADFVEFVEYGFFDGFLDDDEFSSLPHGALDLLCDLQGLLCVLFDAFLQLRGADLSTTRLCPLAAASEVFLLFVFIEHWTMYRRSL